MSTSLLFNQTELRTEEATVISTSSKTPIGKMELAFKAASFGDAGLMSTFVRSGGSVNMKNEEHEEPLCLR